MPQLTFKGLTVNELCSISEELKKGLVDLIKCNAKDVRFDLMPTINIEKGTVVEDFPKVEMLWFPRGQEDRDLVARYLTEEIGKLGYEHIQVNFHEFDPKCYYENGQHF